MCWLALSFCRSRYDVVIMATRRGFRAIFTKRACARLTLLILAGAMVNVGVAWGLISASDRPRILTVEPSRPLTSDEISALFTRYRRSEWVGHTEDGGVHTTALNFTSLNSAGVLDPPAGSVIHYILREARYGMPFRALRSVQRTGLGPEGSGPFLAEHLHSVQVSNRWLPTDILWPGFAINTAFYAALIWMLFSAPAAMRRRRRRSHRMCVKCGYDLRGRAEGRASEVCPECGERVALKSRSRGAGA